MLHNLQQARPEIVSGKDGGGSKLGPKTTYEDSVVAEYVWVDADGVQRSKTKTLERRPRVAEDLGVWNFDGSSTGQASGENSDVLFLLKSEIVL